MPITLQGTADFEPEFVGQLSALTRAMLDAGLDPSDFVISKDAAATGNVPVIGPFFYDYTVFVVGEQFTVTEPNDQRFLEYFQNRIIADESSAHDAVQKANTLLARFTRWMAQPV